jgi:hypothetical protein
MLLLAVSLLLLPHHEVTRAPDTAVSLLCEAMPTYCRPRQPPWIRRDLRQATRQQYGDVPIASDATGKLP